MIELKGMSTETQNELTQNLDAMSPLEIVTAMNKEDANVPLAVQKVLPEIANAAEWVTEAFRAGGRLIYMGAGTSGRLGVLDAVECPPTFGVSHELVVGLIAGGDGAFIKAVEGAEDSRELGVSELKEINLSQKDILIGIAASGRTPYVCAGLEYANSLGCKTVAIACNSNSEVGKCAQLKIEAIPGPEVLTGSTRLKAGTAQKMILNMISTASMVGFGKVYKNYMVDVMPTNEKLCVRAENIIMAATQADRETAKQKLQEANKSVKLAIVMILFNCGAEEARAKLETAGGHIRKTLEN